MNCPYGECDESGSFEELMEHRITTHGEPRPTFMENNDD